MLYKFFKVIFGVTLRVFFREIEYVGSPKESGPLIVVSNHPNHMLDPLVIGYSFKRELWFLAKSTLFKPGPIALFLKCVHMIPVYRQQDKTETGADFSAANQKTFQAAVTELAHERAIAIFPEGTSLGERHLSLIKTGAARIAFQALASKENPECHIQPVGITYSDFDQFRSAVTVTFGEPFSVSEFSADYARDPKDAVRLLTKRIETELEKVSVGIKRAEDAKFVEKLAKLFASRATDIDNRERFSLIVRNVEALSPKYPERRSVLEEKITEYFQLARAAGFDASYPIDERYDRFFTALVFPLVLLGVVLHILPYRFIRWHARKLTDPAIIATRKLVLGMFVYPLWYFILAALVQWCFGNLLVTVIALLAMVFSGYYVTHHFYQSWLFLLTYLWPGKRSPLQLMRSMRVDLIAELEELRIE